LFFVAAVWLLSYLSVLTESVSVGNTIPASSRHWTSWIAADSESPIGLFTRKSISTTDVVSVGSIAHNCSKVGTFALLLVLLVLQQHSWRTRWSCYKRKHKEDSKAKVSCCGVYFYLLKLLTKRLVKYNAWVDEWYIPESKSNIVAEIIK